MEKPVSPRHLPASGMTLRDWFAGQALPSVMQDARDFVNPSTAANGPETCAQLSYAIADALLAARTKGEDNG